MNWSEYKLKDYSELLKMEWHPSNHQRMPTRNRAKQYMPMDALRGFSLAILTKQAEQEFVDRIPLSADAKDQLCRKLSWLSVGEWVTVKHFRIKKQIGNLEIGTYVTESGPLELLDKENGALVLPQLRIRFGDILELDSNAFNGEFADDPEVKTYVG